MPPPDALLCIRYGLFSLIACCACISLTSLKCPKNAFTKLTRRKTLNRATLKEKRLAHSRNGQTRELYVVTLMLRDKPALPGYRDTKEAGAARLPSPLTKATGFPPHCLSRKLEQCSRFVAVLSESSFPASRELSRESYRSRDRSSDSPATALREIAAPPLRLTRDR